MRTRNHGSRFDGILKNEIASFWAVKARKLAISKPISPGKSILDQPFGWFFTADSLVASVCPLVDRHGGATRQSALPSRTDVASRACRHPKPFTTADMCWSGRD